MNGTHRPPDALAPLINVRRGAEGDKQTPNVISRGEDTTATVSHATFSTHAIHINEPDTPYKMLSSGQCDNDVLRRLESLAVINW